MQASKRNPCVLYLSVVEQSPSHAAKLAGIRRYCDSRGWTVLPVSREMSTVEALPGILRLHQPVGCVVDGVSRHADLKPRLFRGIPVSYISYPRAQITGHPNFFFSSALIAQAALRELSAARPPCYAAIGFPSPWPWSRGRVSDFRRAVAATGATCLAFPARPCSEKETFDDFVGRLVPWLAKLPEHCAVFAVSDETAVRVARAARLAGRHIPSSLTLLSVDNFTALCEGAEPPISSIQLDFERQGFVAAKSLEEPDCENANVLGPLLTVRRKSTSGRGRHEKFIQQAVEIIRREAADGLTVEELLTRFPQSRRNFERYFREATGHSILDEILHVRLEKACALLAQTNTAIGAISGLCGFRSGCALHWLFKSRFQMSMREWRQKNAH